MGKINDVALDQIRANREDIIGIRVYAGDMGSRPVIVTSPDHSQHTPRRQYLGSQYVDLLTGEPAYRMVIDCWCCQSGKHNYLPAVKGSWNGDNAESTYVGRICTSCGQLEPLEEMEEMEEVPAYRTPGEAQLAHP